MWRMQMCPHAVRVVRAAHVRHALQTVVVLIVAALTLAAAHHLGNKSIPIHYITYVTRYRTTRHSARAAAEAGYY